MNISNISKREKTKFEKKYSTERNEVFFENYIFDNTVLLNWKECICILIKW